MGLDLQFKCPPLSEVDEDDRSKCANLTAPQPPADELNAGGGGGGEGQGGGGEGGSDGGGERAVVLW